MAGFRSNVWKFVRGPSGRMGKVSSKLESIQQAYENARAEGGRELRNAKKGLEMEGREPEALCFV